MTSHLSKFIVSAGVHDAPALTAGRDDALAIVACADGGRVVHARSLARKDSREGVTPQ